MRTSVWKALAALSLLAVLACDKGPAVYPIRWVYLSNGLREDSDVEDFRQVAVKAAEHGLNGVYLSAGFDAIDMKDEDYFRRLGIVKALCDSLQMVLVPRCMDVGYNGALLSHDRNLAEGIPVREALYLVKDGQADLVPDPAVGFDNGGFEARAADGLPGGWEPGGALGEVAFIDDQVMAEGKQSLRFENFGGKEDNPGRLVRKLQVSPDRLYRLTLMVKTEGVDQGSPFGSGRFQVRVLGAGDQRPLTYYRPKVGSDTDWTRVTVDFNSRNYSEVELSVGVFGAKSGKLWLDDLGIREVGMVNLLRRGGTPLVVKSDQDGTVYEEGQDFEPVVDPQLNYRYDHEGPAIKLTQGSRIKEGDQLRVSFYHSVTVYDGQVTVCMSEPKVYEIWRNNVRLLKEHLSPKYYFVSADEIRTAGTCEACRSRGISLGEILGDCITKQVAIIEEVDPEAEMVVWSDMLDPNHNARQDRPFYYHADESFYGSWEYVPKELIIACWNHRVREQSLAHFDSLGFRTMACGYYDEDNISNDSTWVQALDATPRALGIMYTSWLHKFELLDEWGDFVSTHQLPKDKPKL